MGIVEIDCYAGKMKNGRSLLYHFIIKTEHNQLTDTVTQTTYHFAIPMLILKFGEFCWLEQWALRSRSVSREKAQIRELLDLQLEVIQILYLQVDTD